MGLTEYRKKRSFTKTPEPEGGKTGHDTLRFVIQKHDASHLHYDFRLEMRGVLKSWAVPKGPSTDPQTKRLAMMVEDHPYDYRTFEGIIPKGQYGGGTVIVWDEGTYESLDKEAKTKKEHEKVLMAQLKAGSLKFRLKGKKLKGEFALVRAFGRDEKSWLLIKHKDRYASANDILKKDKSVISRKTIAQMAKAPDRIHQSNREPAARKAAPEKKTAKPETRKASAKNKKAPVKTTRKTTSVISATAGVKKNFPAKIRPMLATLVDQPFDKEGWLYEVKWDGYRALALLNKGAAELKSRNDKSFNDKFYPVYEAVKKLKINAVLDGEIVVINEDGISHFGQLQNWRSEADGELIYYVFDILWLDGYDLTGLTLRERKAILRKAVKENGTIRISDDFETSGTEFLETAKSIGLEGIMAKYAESRYMPGERTRDWLKIKSNKRQEVVIGGFTRNEGSPKLFSSLLVGVYEQGKLQYTGKIGTGFSDQLQREMMTKFKPLITKRSPFSSIPDISKPSRFRPDPPAASATWLKPELVCEVSFVEMTTDGVMRHPSFEGMRMDKAAADVKNDKEVKAKQVIKEHEVSGKKVLTPSQGKSRKTLLNPSEETQVRKINGHELKFTNLSKLYWPDEKITKRDMLNYYYQVAPYILPYLSDRPQSLNRHPNGIRGHSFYQKDVTGKAPGWIKTFPYRTDDDPQQKNFLVCTDEASLLYMATLGCIELHPWSSRIGSPDEPDWCLIDLDPGKSTKFEQVIEAARVTKDILDSLKVPSYCKTSGSTGLHIYIPLGAKYTYEESKEFARVIAAMVVKELPGFTTIQRNVAARRGKMYIDFLQNRPQATLAAPYSLRPKPGATVSMPLHWEEVKKGLQMKDFNIFNAVDRIRSEGDIFKKVLGKGIDLEKVIKRLG